MNTWFALLAQFGGRSIVPYTEIAIALMGVTHKTARNWRHNGRWPECIPITEAGMVDLRDVATWWDAERARAAKAAA